MKWFRKSKSHTINIDNGQELKLLCTRGRWEVHLTYYGILKTIINSTNNEEETMKQAEEFYEKLISQLDLIQT